MRAVVIKLFTDLKDNNHEYRVGDEYPRAGVSVSKERIEELAGSNNKQHTPLIELIEEPVNEPAEEEPADEKPAIEKPKRGRKKKG